MSSEITLSSPHFITLLEVANLNAETGAEVDRLQKVLDDLVVQAWQDGLVKDCLDVLVTMFTAQEFVSEVRKRILHCLVPREKISIESATAMCLWVLANHIKVPDDCILVLEWLKAVVQFKMVPAEVIDHNYHIFVKLLMNLPLAHSMSALLLVSTKPEHMTASNVRFLQQFIKAHAIRSYIPRILWEYAQHVPHLVDKKYHYSKPAVEWDQGLLTSFEKKIKAMALRAKACNTKNSGNSRDHILCRDLPPVAYEYEDTGNGRVKISDVKSMEELGKHLTNLQLPDNQLSLLQSLEGIMYLVTNGPGPEFLHSLEVALTRSPSESLVAVIGCIQNLLTYGFPCVFNFLAEFLTSWDGEYNESYVCSLLPNLRFDKFEDLKNSILDPLFRVYLTSYQQIIILESLFQLCTNMVCYDMARGQEQLNKHIPIPQWMLEPEVTLTLLIEYIIQLYIVGIQVEGPSCTSIVLHAVLFYQKLTNLILKKNLPFFYVIHPALSYPALLSKNAVVINELCHLILTYKREIIPEFEKNGLLGNYEDHVESVMAVADNTYKYLWENVAGERPENFHRTQDEFTPGESLGIKHLGIYPILDAVAKEIGKDVTTLNKSEILNFLAPFIEGVTSFIKYEERETLCCE